MNLTEPGELAVRKWISSGRLARPEGLEPPAYWFEATSARGISNLEAGTAVAHNSQMLLVFKSFGGG